MIYSNIIGIQLRLVICSFIDCSNTIFLYRQVEPSENNRAANCLSEEIQIRNVRKVKVNAQVTFVIYILESVANFSIFVGWFFIFNKNTDSSLVLGIIWFHIILPYTFLMNTSHNKNLVLNDGWGNTIRNTLGLPENINVFSEFNISKYLSRRNRISIKEVENDGRTTFQSRISTSNDIELITDQYTNDISRQDSTLEIPTISKSVEQAKSMENSNFSNFPDSTPSTSKNGLIDNVDEEFSRPIRRMESDSDDDDDFNLNRSDRLMIGEEILSNMMRHLDDEQGYLHYLKELSKFNEIWNKDANAANDFRIVHATDFPTIKKNRIKGSLKEKRNHCKKNQDTDSRPHSKLSTKYSPDKSNNGRSFDDRLKIRTKLLERYQEYCCDEDSFNNLISVMFDIEETMAQDKY